jgi:pyruvate dehydrogenase E2 component (dihydrolipoamide acetyltransferase)
VGAKGGSTDIPLTRAQRTVARRVAESKATIPDLQVAVEADVSGLAADMPVPFTAAVVRACALALREHPRLNGAYHDDAVRLHARVNVGAVVHGDETLTVPTIADADAKPAAAIADELAGLTARVADGTITAPELAGATFTVTDLGPLGARSGVAVIAPGQAAVLAVGAVMGGTVVLTLSADHRIVFPREAAGFLARVAALLGDPAVLLA